ncbi:phosphoadenosine phosphosulfate reductase family protein [[Clostridium] hylemonae]|uniref:phosphoadenosine phosphosulfate reductase domain-containing protein n=1 Tax=[Clostridium] hylemonae TaxID=89153 RepID=UPI001105798A|nr:phosphoadenosine phosphosulfate reductase family protein [[Clostridium] hylemonae]
MYSYTFDEESGGIVLNSTPTNFSKEPRPVYAKELDILGFYKYWNYDKQNDVPYMWAEANAYWYKGKKIATVNGGNLYIAPELKEYRDENGDVLFGLDSGYKLEQIDLVAMRKKNRDLMMVIEDATVKKIVKEYEKFKKKLDIFHVAFSGGKDSAVLLDLVKKALPQGSFVVIFGDTGMEFPDTYKAVDVTRIQCEEDGTPFYTSKSHFKPEDSWHLFGPPARVLRWCCSVHKSTPQTLKMREITGKNDYIGMDFVGVRKHESVTRSKYDYENVGKKQKGQYSYNPILEWTSAEIWLYIFEHDVYVNEAYKKGNSRAGCLFCPMGGGKGDYLQRACYPKEVEKYIDMIKTMNARDAGNEAALSSYVSNGGWNARKNGRDLNIEDDRYKEEVKNGQLLITITNPQKDWREWIKTVGPLSFEFKIKEMVNGYQVSCDAKVIRKHSTEVKRLRQVFKKSAYCVDCNVCVTNCRNGCISFENGLTITNCISCGQCHEIDDGCLVYHSIRSVKGGGIMRKESINSFANHAPKPEWVEEFFDVGEDYWENNTLNKKNQEPKLKIFFRDGGFTDAKGVPTELFKIVSGYGYNHAVTWGLFMANFAYNKQCRWYIENMDAGVCYSREQIVELLVNNEEVKLDDATSIVNAFKRFCLLPLGTAFDFGYVEMAGKQIATLCRMKCNIEDNRILLYSLYVFAEKCNLDKEFHLSYLYDEEVERDGISPVRIYGLYDEEELKSMLLGLSSVYPEYINASFTNDLKSITLRDKTSGDILNLFKEDM